MSMPNKGVGIKADSWDLVRQFSSRGEGNDFGQAMIDGEGRLEVAYRVLNSTTNFDGD